jgi:replicative DNA helicase
VAAKRPPILPPEEIAERVKEQLDQRVEEAPKTAPRPTERTQRKPAEKRDEIVYDATNERVVIAAAIASRASRKTLVRSLSPDEFLVPEHTAMQRALLVMEEHDLEFDSDVFRRLIADEGVPVDDGYLESIEDAAKVPENLAYHVETLRWDATRARIVRGAMPEFVRLLKDPKTSAEALAGSARALLRAVEGGVGGRKFMRRPDELNRSWKAELAARAASGNFYPSGYDAIDARLVEGVMPKRTSLVVGLSGSGKSTFTADFALRLAALDRRVLVGAWEMGTDSLGLDVMVAQRCRIDIDRVVQGNLTPDELADAHDAIDWITERIHFMDNAFFSIDSGKGRPSNDRSLDVWEGYIAESGCDVVVSDLWERCLIDLSYDGVTKALYRQQDMHARYNVHGIMVHQLKLKEVEQRPDKRPTRESVKGSGAFVEVADLLWGVHRDAHFKRGIPDDSLEVINLKQRKGRAFWSVRFDWQGSCGLITGGEEVPYDPGLEASREFGDVGEINVKQTSKRKPSRRD